MAVYGSYYAPASALSSSQHQPVAAAVFSTPQPYNQSVPSPPTTAIFAPPRSHLIGRLTVACRYYPHCKRGDDCDFGHGFRELKARTHVCFYYNFEGRCSRRGCKFLHVLVWPQRITAMHNRKSTLCAKAVHDGYCCNGEYCYDAHGLWDLHFSKGVLRYLHGMTIDLMPAKDETKEATAAAATAANDGGDDREEEEEGQEEHDEGGDDDDEGDDDGDSGYERGQVGERRREETEEPEDDRERALSLFERGRQPRQQRIYPLLVGGARWRRADGKRSRPCARRRESGDYS